MQRIGGECSDLNYQVNFPAEYQHDFNLTIYVDGPCSDQEISKLSVLIMIKSCKCGRGFMPENNTIIIVLVPVIHEIVHSPVTLSSVMPQGIQLYVKDSFRSNT